MTFLQLQIRFWILWIPVSISLSVGGSTGLQIGIQAKMSASTSYALSVMGGIKPYAMATFTIEVAVDIFIARLGIGGSLNIVDAGIPSSATFTANNVPSVGITSRAEAKFAAGRIYVFAEVGFWIFCCARTESNIVTWKEMGSVHYDLLTMPQDNTFGPVQTPPPRPAANPTSMTLPDSKFEVSCLNQCSGLEGACEWCGENAACCKHGAATNGCSGLGPTGRHGCVAGLGYVHRHSPHHHHRHHSHHRHHRHHPHRHSPHIHWPHHHHLHWPHHHHFHWPHRHHWHWRL